MTRADLIAQVSEMVAKLAKMGNSVKSAAAEATADKDAVANTFTFLVSSKQIVPWSKDDSVKME